MKQKSNNKTYSKNKSYTRNNPNLNNNTNQINSENQTKKVFFNKLDQNTKSKSPKRKSKSKSKLNINPQSIKKEIGSDLVNNPNDDYQTLVEKNNFLREIIIKANDTIINLVNFYSYFISRKNPKKF